MEAAQRVNRGFHRLAVALAGIPLIGGLLLFANLAHQHADRTVANHQKVRCAYSHIERLKQQHPPPKPTGGEGNDRGPTPDSKQSPLAKPKSPRLLSDEEVALLPPLEHDYFHLMFAPDNKRLNLKRMGCSDWDYDTVSIGEARNPPEDVSWTRAFSNDFVWPSGITLAISLALYGVVRTVGWVIVGFKG